MRLPRITAEVVFAGALLIGLIYAVFFWHIKQAEAFPGGGVIVVGPSPVQQCVDTCLAYNGYTTDTYNFCVYQCQYPYPGVVVGGVWIGGIWYPHGDGHRYPRHEEPRHDHGGHDHHGRR